MYLTPEIPMSAAPSWEARGSPPLVWLWDPPISSAREREAAEEREEADEEEREGGK